MNRTDRQYALVDELRAASPQARSVNWLAERFDVSVRTIERDLADVLRAGAPVRADPEHPGDYALADEGPLAPVRFTRAEALALAVALGRLPGPAWHRSVVSARRKLTALLGEVDIDAAEEFAERRVRTGEPVEPGGVAGEAAPGAGRQAGRGTAGSVPAVLQAALAGEHVLELDYADRHGEVSHRTVEPIGFVGGREHWHLLAWCRLRHDIRGFRLDRIRRARVGRERVRARRALPALDVPAELVRRLTGESLTGGSQVG